MADRAIVFDLWYTLVCPDDHRPAGVRTVEAAASALAVDPEHFRAFWKSCAAEMYTTPTPLIDFIERYLAGIGRAWSDGQREGLDALLGQHHDQALRAPRPDVIDAISRLRDDGYRIGLLSNAHEREIRAWGTSPLAELVDRAFFSCFIGCQKPDPTAYATVLDGLGVAASSATFVGDNGSDELVGARDAGFGRVIFMRGLLVEYGVPGYVVSSHASKADAAIDGIPDLVPLLASATGVT